MLHRITLATAVLVTVASCHAQITVIPAFVGTDQEGFETQSAAGQSGFTPCMVGRVFNNQADYCTPGASGIHITGSWSFMCLLFPHSGTWLFGSAQGYTEFDFDMPVTRFGGFFTTNGSVGTVTVQFYDAGRVLLDTFMFAPTQCAWEWLGWESCTGVSFITFTNSQHGGGFVHMDDLEVEWGGGAVPTCTLTTPVSPARDDVDITIDSASPAGSLAVDITFEYSLDAGVTWQLATPAATSPLANPALGVAPGIDLFTWDTRADGVGVALVAAGVLVRATVDDGLAPCTGECQTMPFDVDNTMLCNGICGDCDLNGMGPNILDALQAAQIAAGLLVPTMTQIACCDVNVSGVVDVLDALGIAQSAAGLPVTLMCV